MTFTFRSTRLTTCDTVKNGEAISLRFLDQAGRPVAIELPFAQAEAMVMTLPRLLSKALQARTDNAASRYVFPLGQWFLESGNENCLIMTLATGDGFEVSFGVPFDACQALGWSLEHEGRRATEVAEQESDPTVVN
jgi:hypothetical protein